MELKTVTKQTFSTETAELALGGVAGLGIAWLWIKALGAISITAPYIAKYPELGDLLSVATCYAVLPGYWRYGGIAGAGASVAYHLAQRAGITVPGQGV